MLAALRSGAPEIENVVRSNRKASNHDPREIDNNFIVLLWNFVLCSLFFVLGTLCFVCWSWVLGFGLSSKFKVQSSKY
jgi:hypothetical protein